jgi:hypothetical protein
MSADREQSRTGKAANPGDRLGALPESNAGVPQGSQAGVWGAESANDFLPQRENAFR